MSTRMLPETSLRGDVALLQPVSEEEALFPQHTEPAGSVGGKRSLTVTAEPLDAG